MASVLLDVGDVNRSLAGTLEAIREWLRTCTCVESEEDENLFGLNERAAALQMVVRVLAETHGAWQLYHDGLTKPEPWMAHIKAPRASTIESMWEKYTGGVGSSAVIPLADDGEDHRVERVVADGDLKSETHPTSHKPSGKLLGFLRGKSRIGRPAFYKPVSDQVAPESPASPPKLTKGLTPPRPANVSRLGSKKDVPPKPGKKSVVEVRLAAPLTPSKAPVSPSSPSPPSIPAASPGSEAAQLVANSGGPSTSGPPRLTSSHGGPQSHDLNSSHQSAPLSALSNSPDESLTESPPKNGPLSSGIAKAKTFSNPPARASRLEKSCSAREPASLARMGLPPASPSTDHLVRKDSLNSGSDQSPNALPHLSHVGPMHVGLSGPLQQPPPAWGGEPGGGGSGVLYPRTTMSPLNGHLSDYDRLAFHGMPPRPVPHIGSSPSPMNQAGARHPLPGVNHRRRVTFQHNANYAPNISHSGPPAYSTDGKEGQGGKLPRMSLKETLESRKDSAEAADAEFINGLVAKMGRNSLGRKNNTMTGVPADTAKAAYGGSVGRKNDMVTGVSDEFSRGGMQQHRRSRSMEGGQAFDLAAFANGEQHPEMGDGINSQSIATNGEGSPPPALAVPAQRVDYTAHGRGDRTGPNMDGNERPGNDIAQQEEEHSGGRGGGGKGRGGMDHSGTSGGERTRPGVTASSLGIERSGTIPPATRVGSGVLLPVTRQISGGSGALLPTGGSGRLLPNYGPGDGFAAAEDSYGYHNPAARFSRSMSARHDSAYDGRNGARGPSAHGMGSGNDREFRPQQQQTRENHRRAQSVSFQQGLGPGRGQQHGGGDRRQHATGAAYQQHAGGRGHDRSRSDNWQSTNSGRQQQANRGSYQHDGTESLPPFQDKYGDRQSNDGQWQAVEDDDIDEIPVAAVIDDAIDAIPVQPALDYSYEGSYDNTYEGTYDDDYEAGYNEQRPSYYDNAPGVRRGQSQGGGNMQGGNGGGGHYAVGEQNMHHGGHPGSMYQGGYPPHHPHQNPHQHQNQHHHYQQQQQHHQQAARRVPSGVGSSRQEADAQWEEALQAVSSTMGRKVSLLLTEEELQDLDVNQTMGRGTGGASGHYRR
eukprot:TRINITY_DN9735_c0_g1_i1.p1 TRINITY_DN9735_c0_g1~~TRINITY_DN9735_c0_g1_i1.p1  ORF type:complete len:1151 (-),score=200.47 TRINITY_DN9735_c0_g1_i1:642-3941(-)